MYKMRQITSTMLKQQTKEVINYVLERDEPVIISTYNDPKVMIIKYDQAYISKGKPDIDTIKKHMSHSTKKGINTTKFFRRMRDAK